MIKYYGQDRADRAREWLGMPYEHQGRGAGAADCIALGAHAMGYPMDAIPVYPNNPNNGQLELHLDRVFGGAVHEGQIELDMMEVGDLVAMQYAGPIRHLGIVGDYVHGGLSLIHTDSIQNRVVEHVLDAKWLRRIRRVYR